MKQKLQIIFLLLFIIATQAICIGWVFGKKYLLITGAIVAVIGLAGALFNSKNE